MRSFIVFCVCLAVPGLLSAQEWDRAHRIVGKTMEDLHRIEHRDAWAEPDRGHYDAAEHNLADVNRGLDEHRLERGRLDATIAEIEHITHVDRLDGRIRGVLTEDARELRKLRDEWHFR